MVHVYAYWHEWYLKNRDRHLANSKRWKKEIRQLLFDRHGGKCECDNPNCDHVGICGSTENLELHEPNGNNDKHSSGRLTKMRDGLIEYKLFCNPCHKLTPNYTFRGYRKTIP